MSARWLRGGSSSTTTRSGGTCHQAEVWGPLRVEYLRDGPVASGPPGGIGGREVVLFIGSIDLSVEAWEVRYTWDVERREDGTVVALHPYRRWLTLEEYRSVGEMDLPALTQAVTAAHQARVAANGGRIGEDASLPMLVTDANQLRQYFSDPKVGGYAPGAPTPAQPPPPCGLAVPDQADNPGLMLDCMTLLAARDTLRGTATLNWSVDTAIAGWDGVTVSSTTPKNVTGLDLSEESLSGSIPSELGDLLGLTRLDLSDNSLTGEIPAELGNLTNLTELRLSGNNLTGCIPEALRDVENHDLEMLTLPYCDELDYDGDNDGLIEVSTLSQLNAIRWDLDGDGAATEPAYTAAFPNAQAGMGCPSAGCTGYELTADLDFDTDGSGLVDSGDEYWNGSSGWDPIGEAHNRSFDATFEGNGHTVSNLFINRVHTNDIGLFGNTSAGSVIRNVGLLSAGITGSWSSGGLVGYNRGTITDSYVAGNVTGSNRVGDLVGWNHGGTVTGSYATGNVTGSRYVGGLIGLNMGTVTNSYATGNVTGVESAGGLVGDNYTGTVSNSYATGAVTGESLVGGLVGENDDGTVTDSYWDTETTGLSTSDGGTGKTTVELRSPISNSGIYASLGQRGLGLRDLGAVPGVEVGLRRRRSDLSGEDDHYAFPHHASHRLTRLLLLLAACGSSQGNSTETASPKYLTEEIPPCTPVEGSTVDPCELGAPQLSGGGEGTYEIGPEPRRIRAFLDGEGLAEVHIAHLVVRATFLPGTVRCAAPGDLFRPPPPTRTGINGHSCCAPNR